MSAGGGARIDSAEAGKPAVLILVENLPVPLDRRVWQEACTLRDAGYRVVVICPRMRGYVQSDEVTDGIQIYRHWISEEASGLWGFIGEYASALWGEAWLAWRAWRRHRFRVVHLCNPPDLLFLVAWPFKVLFGVKVVYDVHDLWPEMFEAKFRNRGPAVRSRAGRRAAYVRLRRRRTGHERIRPAGGPDTGADARQPSGGRTHRSEHTVLGI